MKTLQSQPYGVYISKLRSALHPLYLYFFPLNLHLWHNKSVRNKSIERHSFFTHPSKLVVFLQLNFPREDKSKQIAMCHCPLGLWPPNAVLSFFHRYLHLNWNLDQAIFIRNLIRYWSTQKSPENDKSGCLFVQLLLLTLCSGFVHDPCIFDVDIYHRLYSSWNMDQGARQNLLTSWPLIEYQ